MVVEALDLGVGVSLEGGCIFPGDSFPFEFPVGLLLVPGFPFEFPAGLLLIPGLAFEFPAGLPLGPGLLPAGACGSVSALGDLHVEAGEPVGPALLEVAVRHGGG